MRAFLSVLLAFGVVAACSSGSGLTTVNASDYNQSCSTSDDCVAVDDGDICSCTCPSAAINKADLSRYQADVAARRGGCPPMTASCVMCPVHRLSCVAGRCAFELGAADAAADGG